MPNMTRPAPYYAPDGFAASRQPRAGAGLKYAVAASVSGKFVPQTEVSHAARPTQDEAYFHNQEGHDEGLVHSHGWACNA